jgi:hypothetical protein
MRTWLIEDFGYDRFREIQKKAFLMIGSGVAPKTIKEKMLPEDD